MKSDAMPAAARDAAAVLGNQIRQARIERGWTASQTAELVGVSRSTWAAIESGSAGVALGAALSAAALVGVPLFGVEDAAEMARLRRDGERILAPLPTRVRRPQVEIDDDF